MRKTFCLIAGVLLLLALAACAAEKTSSAAPPAAPASSEASPQAEAAEWDIPETTEMTEEVTAVFERATEKLLGVNYEPIAFLGESEGLYCVLCRATVVAPQAKPSYALVYVSDAGVQNVWEIWMEKHAQG